MCGGGGSSPPPPPDPMEEARAQIAIEQERARIAAQQEAAARARKEAEQARKQQEFDANLGAARASGSQGALDLIGQRGLDVDYYDPLVAAELDRIQSTVPNLAPNPGSYFVDDIIADAVLNRETGLQRQGFLNQFENFAPTGFAQEAFPSTADDAILDAIFAEQYEPASQNILRAFNRGNLSQQGYDLATENLGTFEPAARSRLQEVGGGVLEGNRQQLRDIASQGRTAAGAFELGQAFDPSTFESRIGTTTGELSGRLEGDIRSALGGENLFPIDSVIQKAQIGQGASNEGSPALLAALSESRREKDKKRGLGQSGVF